MASKVVMLVRSLCGRPATPWEWGVLVQVARDASPVLGVEEVALPDDLFVAPAGAIALATPEGGVAVIVPEEDLRIASGAADPVQRATAVALLVHELAHVAVLRRIPGLSEPTPETCRDLEAVALLAQSRVLARLLGSGTWQEYLVATVDAARAVAEGDPLLSVYEAAEALLLGEWRDVSYVEAVELAVRRVA